MSEIPFFASRAAFAMRVGQLSTMLYEQMETCLVSHGLRLPGYTTSIVQNNARISSANCTPAEDTKFVTAGRNGTYVLEFLITCT